MDSVKGSRADIAKLHAWREEIDRSIRFLMYQVELLLDAAAMYAKDRDFFEAVKGTADAVLGGAAVSGDNGLPGRSRSLLKATVKRPLERLRRTGPARLHRRHPNTPKR